MTKGRYWPEKDFEGEGQGQEISLESGPWTHYNVTNVFLGCNYQIQRGQKGKYMIEIANLWEFNIELSVAMTIDYSDLSISRVGESFEYHPVVFSLNVTQVAYDIFMVTPGKWYLSAYTCGLPVNITIESVKKKEIITLRNGGHLYQETIDNQPIDAPPEDRWRKITIMVPEGVDPEGKIEMYSTVVNEPEFMNYELKEDPKLVILKKKDQRSWGRKFTDLAYPIDLTVQFEPLKFNPLSAGNQKRIF